MAEDTPTAEPSMPGGTHAARVRPAMEIHAAYHWPDAQYAGANFTGRGITGSMVPRINLQGATLDDATIIDTLAPGADLRRATGRRATFRDSQLTGGQFQEARLQDPRFFHCTLGAAKFTGAAIENATFVGCKVGAQQVVLRELTPEDLIQLPPEQRAFIDGKFATVDWSAANFDDVVAPRITIGDCTFEHASFKRAEMNLCVISNGRFQNADFSGARLTAGVLTDGVFTHARFDGAQLDGIIFRGAPDFTRARFTGANLSHSTLRGYFTGADFTDAVLDAATLTGGHYVGASFTRANLTRAHLEDCRLDGMLFQGTVAPGARFDRALLQECYFRSDDQAASNLRGAHFENAELLKSTFSGVDLTGAQFNDAKLHEARFANCDLRGVHFDHAELYFGEFRDITGDNALGLDFRGAKLEGATFRNCDLSNAIFNGVDLAHVTFVNCTMPTRDLGRIGRRSEVEEAAPVRVGASKVDPHAATQLAREDTYPPHDTPPELTQAGKRTAGLPPQLVEGPVVASGAVASRAPGVAGPTGAQAVLREGTRLDAESTKVLDLEAARSVLAGAALGADVEERGFDGPPEATVAVAPSQELRAMARDVEGTVVRNYGPPPIFGGAAVDPGVRDRNDFAHSEPTRVQAPTEREFLAFQAFADWKAERPAREGVRFATSTDAGKPMVFVGKMTHGEHHFGLFQSEGETVAFAIGASSRALGGLGRGDKVEARMDGTLQFKVLELAKVVDRGPDR